MSFDAPVISCVVYDIFLVEGYPIVIHKFLVVPGVNMWFQTG